MPLPTNRTTSDSAADHVADHNTAHDVVNRAVTTDGAQTVTGVKTFQAAPVFNDGAIPEAKVSGLTAALAGKSSTSHLHAGVYEAVGVAASAVASHAAEADPHTGYQRESEKGQANGYAELDGTNKVPAVNLGGAGGTVSNFLRGDGTWGDPVSAHVAASDPHSAANYVIMASGGGRRIYVQDTEPTGMQAGDIWIETDAAAGATNLDSLTDVVITAAAAGEVLRHNGTNWVDATLSLDDLSDAVITSAAQSNRLTHNGTNWINAKIPVAFTIVSPTAGNVTATDMPAATQELGNTTRYRTKLDLTHFSEFRVTARVMTAGVAGGRLGVHYSTDESTWVWLDGTASASAPAAGYVGMASALATEVSAWTSLASGAKADVFIRPATNGGDGVADPAFGLVTVQVR